MESSNSVPGAQTETEEPILRRSTRVRKPVTRLNF
ncbi:ATP binding cassette (ABC) transporter subfamily C member, partial [Diabrotica virgifera virgifera]